MKMILTVGLPGSGKSTWALQYCKDNPGTVNVNRDSIRMNQFGVWYGPEVDENFVTTLHESMIAAVFKKGRDVVISDTNLNRKTVRRLADVARDWGATVKFVYFDVSIEELVARDKVRAEKPVGEKVIRDFAKRFKLDADGALPRMDEFAFDGQVRTPYIADKTKPEAIIVDLDGTVALHRRSAYDYDLCYTDLPNEAVVNLVRLEYSIGTHVLFTSGRPDSHYKMTNDWILDSMSIEPDRYPTAHLFMRQAGDKRKDSVIKYELFDKHIRHDFNVKYNLDDRDQVVRMWREIGLTCLQVNWGDF